jgi:hypothetical protein
MRHGARHAAGSSRQGFREMMSSYLHEVRYGLVLALATLAWITLEYAVGLHTTHIAYHSIVTNFFAVIPIYLMWRALKYRRDVLEGGQIAWWQGVTSGMVISVVAGAFGAPTIWIFVNYINPKFFTTMIEAAVQDGTTKPEQAEAYLNFAAYAIQATLMPIMAGFFTSVVLTGIARWQVSRRGQTEPKPS